ncbi:proteasome subunit beta [Candidatus Woesearchaeota archaeon]|nr:MAG: proteasome subunit beta [Candidatus Woesearchaeota archaeon]
MSKSERLSTGTTTVGIVCKDGVILAADRRATAGNLIVDKKVEKVFPVSERIAVTVAGNVSDIQLLTNYLRAELRLRRIRSGRHPTVKESAHLLSTWVYSIIRSQYGVCHFLMGGYDRTHALYDIFPDGSLTKIDDFVASGSGSVIAYGVLEDAYKEHLTLEEGKALALRAINAALQRDSASGNGVTLFVIDKHGVRKDVAKTITASIK